MELNDRFNINFASEFRKHQSIAFSLSLLLLRSPKPFCFLISFLWSAFCFSFLKLGGFLTPVFWNFQQMGASVAFSSTGHAEDPFSMETVLPFRDTSMNYFLGNFALLSSLFSLRLTILTLLYPGLVLYVSSLLSYVSSSSLCFFPGTFTQLYLYSSLVVRSLPSCFSFPRAHFYSLFIFKKYPLIFPECNVFSNL